MSRWLRYGHIFRRIPLTQGEFAIVDPEDYNRLSKHKWYAVKNGRNFYAVRATITKDGKRRRIHMHRCVLPVPCNIFIDHINRNPLDNRKDNLRPATPAQNVRNRAKFTKRIFSSKYKGVSWHRKNKLWYARIEVNGNRISLGWFSDEILAAKAYDRAAGKYFEEFAVFNFPIPELSLYCRLLSYLCAALKSILLLPAKLAALNSSNCRAGLLKWPPPCKVNTVSEIKSVAEAGKPGRRLKNNLPLTSRRPIRKVMAMPKKLYIIDGHAHIYAAYYAKMRQLTSPAGEPTKATYIFTTAILGLIQRKKPDMLVVTMDSKAPTFRHELYSEYKATRSPMPDDMPQQINRIVQILTAMRIPIFRLDGYEADDLIGTIAARASADGYDCLLCSRDKDLLQLLDEHVSTYDIKTGEVTDVAAMKRKMDLTPAQFVDALALQGDTSDNVPGVPDVGPKTALTWIREYGSIENLYEHIDDIKGKRGDNLREFKDKLELSKTLVTIDCNVPIEIDYNDLALKNFNDAGLAEIFSELGFSRLLTQLNLKSPADLKSAQLIPEVEQKDWDKPDSATTTQHDYQLIDTPQKLDKFAAELNKQKLFAVDTETTALDPMRAELVGISFSWLPHKAFYLPVKAPLGTQHLHIGDVRKKLAPILADENVKKIGQNIKYDILILKNAKLPLKGVYFDTMVASYCLDAQRRRHSMDKMAADFLNYECIPLSSLIGKGKNQLTFDVVDTAAACEYSGEDADITLRLYHYLRQRLEKQPDLYRLFEQLEMPLVPVLAEMEYNGVSLNTKLLRKMSGVLTDNLQVLTDSIYKYAGEHFNIDSPKQLAEILFDKLNLSPIRIGKTGMSTDAAVLEQLADEHPIIEQILQYRTLSKLQNTYADKLGSLINPKTGRVHASFNQTITATGRLSSSNPNLQNIPIRTELGRKIRSAFVPQNKTDCILSADYSQIELRLLAHFSDDAALKDAFAADRDIHSFVASQIYGVPIEEVTGEMRSACKAVNFGIIYGQSAFGLSRSIGISRAEAKKFIDDYFNRYSSIREFMDEVIEAAKSSGYAETILHRQRKILNLTSKNANKKAQAERLAVNTVIQGSAADLCKIAMVNIHRKIEAENLPVKLILQIHDELVFELPAAEAEKHAGWINREMAGALKLSVPLKVDISYGPTWLSEK